MPKVKTNKDRVDADRDERDEYDVPPARNRGVVPADLADEADAERDDKAAEKRVYG